MNRLDTRLGQIRRSGKKILSLFVTAGVPRLEDTVPIVLSLARNGTDLIELGIPFSDPIADGPVIQASSDLALKNGVTLESIFAMAKAIREKSGIPIILMGYANSIFRFGMDNFLLRARDAGADGCIIADLPVEESAEYLRLTNKYDQAGVFLAAPTTSDERLRQLDENTEGFLYCISVTGVTGERASIVREAVLFLERARRNVIKHPILAGFGISNARDAAEISKYCDGVVIGSALVKLLMKSGEGAAADDAGRFAKEMRDALDGCI